MPKKKKEPARDEGRESVKAFLTTLGFPAQVIGEGDTQTPDLFLPEDSRRIHIEVKMKVDDDHLRRILDSEPGSSHAYNNPSIQSRLREARKQISALPDRNPEDFSLVWMLCVNRGLTVLIPNAAIGLLYGIQTLDGFTENDKKSFFKPCYFFANSWFFSNKDLDAVVLQDFRGVRLCLNPFSIRESQFRQSAFAKFFQANFDFIDPAQEEAAGECFIADCDIPRKDVNSLVKYLVAKYGLITPVTIVQPIFVNHPV